MAQNKTLETVAAVSFTIDYVEDFFLKFVPLTETACPVVSGTAAVFTEVNVFGIVKLKKVDFNFQFLMH
jgi:hypothetical protein